MLFEINRAILKYQPNCQITVKAHFVVFVVNLIPDSMKYTGDPDPMRCDP